MASASFLLNGSIPTGANLLAAGSTALLALADIAGASNTAWSFIGSSEDVVLPTITLTGKGTASFVVPSAPSHGLGLSLLLQCVNAGQTARALICVGDDLMVAANEIDERSALGGWAWQWNENLRSAMLTRDGKAYLGALTGNATWALTGAADFQDFKHLTISGLDGANRTITLTTTGAVLNDSVELVFTGDSSAYSLALSNGSTTLATLESYRTTTVKLWFNGTAWEVTSNVASPLAKRAFTTTLSGATAWYIAGAAGVTGSTDLTVSSLGGADRTLTLWETRAVTGDKAVLTYLGSDEGYALTLNAGAGGTLATLPAWRDTRVELYYTGSAWVVLSSYTLGGGGVIKAYSGTLSGATAWYPSGSGALDGCRSVTVTGLGGADRTLTLWETYAVAGDEVTLRFTGTANILTLAAGAGGTLATLLPGRDNEVVLVYSGSAWAVAKQRQTLTQKAFNGAITANGTWSLAGSGPYAGCTTVTAASLDTNRTITLDTLGALAGDRVVLRNMSDLYSLTLTGLATLNAGQYQWASMVYSGSAWVVERIYSEASTSVNNSPLYGVGGAGNLVCSGASEYTLSDETEYDTISFSAGFTGHINCVGWDLICLHLNLANAPAGAIRIGPVTAATSAVATTPGSGGIGPTVTGPLRGGTNGTTGGGGVTTNSNGGSSTNAATWSTTVAQGGDGGNGGAGGNSNVPTGGTGGTGGASRIARWISRYVVRPLYTVYLAAMYTPAGGQAGGGGGGGAGSAVGVQSGGGGGGGYSTGVMRVLARRITTDGTTATGVFDLSGGNGSNGAAGVASANSAGGGGGGGGGGAGYLEVWHVERVGTPIALVNLSGGSGGNAANGQSGGSTAYPGVAGAAGGQGSLLVGNTSTGVVTKTLGTITAVTGSGLTGGTNTFSGSF